MYVRITNNMMLSGALYHLTKNGRNLWKLQEQAASGRRILDPSDDPTGAMVALRLRGQIQLFQQYQRNIDFGLQWLNYTEAVLNDLEDLINRAREVAVSQASDTASRDTREASAAYIEGLKETALQLANSKFEDRYIFAGLKAGAPYGEDGGYQGDSGGFFIAVSEDIRVQLNLTGPEVFGGAGQSLFDYLDQLAQALRDDDTEGIARALNDLEDALNRVIEARSKVGSRYAQLEAYKQILGDRAIKVTEGLSEIVDADIAEVITELSSRQLAYQATLLVTRRLFDETLISLLR